MLTLVFFETYNLIVVNNFKGFVNNLKKILVTNYLIIQQILPVLFEPISSKKQLKQKMK